MLACYFLYENHWKYLKEYNRKYKIQNIEFCSLSSNGVTSFICKPASIKEKKNINTHKHISKNALLFSFIEFKGKRLLTDEQHIYLFKEAWTKEYFLLANANTSNYQSISGYRSTAY